MLDATSFEDMQAKATVPKQGAGHNMQVGARTASLL
jgi:hypothetical protein